MEINRRGVILQTITDFAGIHFRSLQRKLDIGNGNLEHHLQVLLKSKVIVSDKKHNSVYFYPNGMSECEKNIISMLRHEKCRQIIICLLKKNATLTQLSRVLQNSCSTTTWYVTKLVENNVITVHYEKKKKLYSLRVPVTIVELLQQYKHSFADSIVEAFIDAWEF